MGQLVIRIRPRNVMENLDLAVVRDRLRKERDWEVTLHDSRISDAPYVTVLIAVPTVDEQLVDRIVKTFSDLPQMRAALWRRANKEIPIEVLDRHTLESAFSQEI